MNVIEDVEREFKAKVCENITLLSEGTNRFRVFTPFRFDDGDHLAIVLKKVGNIWILSDEGHTFMHLSYFTDIRNLDKGNKAKIITDTLSNFGIVEEEGALISNLDFPQSGNIFYNYIQGLIKITDVTYLSREIVKSTFLDDFKDLILSTASEERVTFDYHDPVRDPDSMYSVDCRLNNLPRPLFLFAINNDTKCKDVTINLHQYENWDLQFRSVAIFEDQEQISRRVLARFSDVNDKQFSSLYSNKDRIQRFIGEAISNPNLV